MVDQQTFNLWEKSLRGFESHPVHRYYVGGLYVIIHVFLFGIRNSFLDSVSAKKGL